MPLDWLAVEPRPYPERKHHSRSYIGDSEGIVIASEGDDVGDHAEDRIIVHKEGIGFLQRSQTDSLSSRERHSIPQS